MRVVERPHLELDTLLERSSLNRRLEIFHTVNGLIVDPADQHPVAETAHAIRATIIEALKCKESGQEKCLVFNFSGHGLCDLGSYDRYFAGELEDYSYPQEKIAAALAELPEIE